jgi:phenylalanyl-tRNA synthetase beta chain
LQISEDHDGIIDLPGDAPVGTRYADWAHLGDPVIEINLTPNRPDCTGDPASPATSPRPASAGSRPT